MPRSRLPSPFFFLFVVFGVAAAMLGVGVGGATAAAEGGLIFSVSGACGVDGGAGVRGGIFVFIDGVGGWRVWFVKCIDGFLWWELWLGVAGTAD